MMNSPLCSFPVLVFYCEGDHPDVFLQLLLAVSTQVSFVSVVIFELRSNIASAMAERNHFSELL